MWMRTSLRPRNCLPMWVLNSHYVIWSYFYEILCNIRQVGWKYRVKKLGHWSQKIGGRLTKTKCKFRCHTGGCYSRLYILHIKYRHGTLNSWHWFITVSGRWAGGAAGSYVALWGQFRQPCETRQSFQEGGKGHFWQYGRHWLKYCVVSLVRESQSWYHLFFSWFKAEENSEKEYIDGSCAEMAQIYVSHKGGVDKLVSLSPLY